MPRFDFTFHFEETDGSGSTPKGSAKNAFISAAYNQAVMFELDLTVTGAFDSTAIESLIDDAHDDWERTVKGTILCHNNSAAVLVIKTNKGQTITFSGKPKKQAIVELKTPRASLMSPFKTPDSPDSHKWAVDEEEKDVVALWSPDSVEFESFNGYKFKTGGNEMSQDMFALAKKAAKIHFQTNSEEEEKNTAI